SRDVVVPLRGAMRRRDPLPQPIGDTDVELDHVDPDLVARRCHSPRTGTRPPCPPLSATNLSRWTVVTRGDDRQPVGSVQKPQLGERGQPSGATVGPRAPGG